MKLIKFYFITSPKIVWLLLKNKKFAKAISAIIANPILAVAFVPVFIKFGWVIGICSIAIFMLIGLIFNIILVSRISKYTKADTEALKEIIKVRLQAIKIFN